MKVIRVMSYNIHAGIGMDDQYDVERIADVIRHSGADIVGLQEVDVHWGSRSNDDNMAETLADLLGMHMFYAPIYELPTLQPQPAPQHSCQFGVALLSKYPIQQAVNLPMTRLSSQDASPTPKPMPGFASVVLNVDGNPLTVYVVHLDYQTNPVVRRRQVEEMLDTFANHASETVLVLGDFNARPDAEELIPLLSVLPDTWSSSHPGDPGFTFPAHMPKQKIDYIVTSPGVRTLRTEIIHSHASDHRPIVADLVFSQKTR